LSRTAAHDASLLGTILIPYFLSNSMTDAMTTDAQSVSGMNPTFTSFFSGASEPCAHAPARIAGSTSVISAPAADAPSKRRFDAETASEAGTESVWIGRWRGRRISRIAVPRRSSVSQIKNGVGAFRRSSIERDAHNAVVALAPPPLATKC